MKNIIVFSALLCALLTFANVNAKATDFNCLYIMGPDNYDEIMIDTCKNSPTYKKLWSKNGYEFISRIYLFKKKPITYLDTLSIVDFDDIPASIKQGFINLENNYGSLRITRSSTSYHNYIDSLHLLSPMFVIQFKRYIYCDSVINDINSISKDSIKYTTFEHRPTPSSVIINEDNNINIYPNPTEHFLNIEAKTNFISEGDKPVIYSLLMERISIAQNQIQTSDNKMLIDISALPGGVYILQIGKFKTLFLKK